MPLQRKGCLALAQGGTLAVVAHGPSRACCVPAGDFSAVYVVVRVARAVAQAGMMGVAAIAAIAAIAGMAVAMVVKDATTVGMERPRGASAALVALAAATGAPRAAVAARALRGHEPEGRANGLCNRYNRCRARTYQTRTLRRRRRTRCQLTISTCRGSMAPCGQRPVLGRNRRNRSHMHTRPTVPGAPRSRRMRCNRHHLVLCEHGSHQARKSRTKSHKRDTHTSLARRSDRLQDHWNTTAHPYTRGVL